MMNRGDILILQRILGHQKIEQTMTYAHFSPDHLISGCSTKPLRKLVGLHGEIVAAKWRHSFVKTRKCRCFSYLD
ncbi:hypothetical protein [Vibrio hyugaensis]|uniref:hypothetical protein n=1 Tax=Vibrio hyugaensis TaxID=1534743 RepID=UPI004037C5B1